MKTSVKLLLLLAFLPFAGFTQGNPLSALIEKYKDKTGFHFLDVNTNMISDEPGKVIQLKMLAFDEKDNASFRAKKIYDDFFKKIDKTAYKGLVEVKSSGDHVEMMVKKNGDKISGIIIAVQGETETVFITASGDISMKELGKFGDLNKCKGLQVLEELCEE